MTLLLSNPISEIKLNNTSDNILDVAVKEKKGAVVMAIAENDRLLSQYNHKCLVNTNVNRVTVEIVMFFHLARETERDKPFLTYPWM